MDDLFFEPNALAIAQHQLRRERMELELLAVIAGNLPAGVSMLKDRGIDPSLFFASDARTIAKAFWVIGTYQGEPFTQQQAIDLVADALQADHAWDPDDHSRQLRGYWWGPGSLTHLMSCIAFDRTTVRLFINRLLMEVKHGQH